jgi:hypothetical protein
MENTELVKLEDVGQPDWLENMNWEEYEKFAAIGYSPENIAMYYKVNKLEFMYYYMMIESELEYHYKRGILVNQAKEGLAMLDDASSNATQAQRLDKLRKKVEFMNARDEIIYGGV